MQRPLSRRPRLNKLTNTALAVLNQDYIGDINILPPFRLSNPTRVMSPLSEDEIARLMSMGEKAVWPKLEMIRIQTRISSVLSRLTRSYTHSFDQDTNKKETP